MKTKLQKILFEMTKNGVVTFLKNINSPFTKYFEELKFGYEISLTHNCQFYELGAIIPNEHTMRLHLDEELPGILNLFNLFVMTNTNNQNSHLTDLINLDSVSYAIYLLDKITTIKCNNQQIPRILKIFPVVGDVMLGIDETNDVAMSDPVTDEISFRTSLKLLEDYEFDIATLVLFTESKKYLFGFEQELNPESRFLETIFLHKVFKILSLENTKQLHKEIRNILLEYISMFIFNVETSKHEKSKVVEDITAKITYDWKQFS